jgi:hypothetical protein
MAAAWLSVLKMVPWSDVISNAPLVADGAKKLWGTVAGKVAPADSAAPDGSGAEATLSPEAKAMAALQSRVQSLESRTTELSDQMVASAQVIKALAEQNASLIKRMEASRVRALWLAATTAFLALLTLGQAAYLLWVR